MHTPQPNLCHNPAQPTDQQVRQCLTDLLLGSVASAASGASQVGVLAPDAWPPRACDQQNKADDARLIVLTLSAYRFQSLMCVMATPESAADTLDDDMLKELANNLCGTFKRYLGRYVAVLGMSTPNRLPVECLRYLHTGPRSDNPAQAPIAIYCTSLQGIHLNVCLMLQGTPELALFSTDTGEMNTDTTGELELF